MSRQQVKSGARSARTWFPVVMGCSAILAGCGSGTSSAVGPGGYLSSDATEVAFIQLTTAGNNLSGSFDYLGIEKSSDPYTLTPISESITGVEHGNDLSFSVGGIGSKTLTGSKDGKGIVVEFQQSDGTIQTIRFVPASVAAYNVDVEKLRSRIDAEQEAATLKAQRQAASEAAQQQKQEREQQAAAAAAAKEEALNSEASAVADEIQTISSDVKALEGLSSFTADLNSLASDLATMKSDLATEESDDVDAAANNECGNVASDAGNVGSDQGNIGSDSGSLDSDIASASEPITTVENDLTTLKNDEATFVAALASDQGAPLTGPDPTAAEVNAAEQSATNQLAAAQGAIATAKSQQSADTNAAATLDQQANSIAGAC